MTIKLPQSVEAYFNADREGNPDAVAAAFTEDGSVKDKGRTHKGRDAIRKWMADESKQYSYIVKPFFIATENGKTQVTAQAVGTFPGSPIDLRFLFVLLGDKVAELEIAV